MIILSFFTGRVAQLVERQSNKLPVEGSSPFVTIFMLHILCSNSRGVLASKVTTAAIAQLGERQTEDLKVPGSIPGVGTYFGRLFEHGLDYL